MLARTLPDTVALRDGASILRYGAFSEASERLAAQLAGFGVAEEVLVGICLPRSFDRIIATLAVWKLGGAVLALDPAWPLQRLRSLLADAQSPLVLASDGLASGLGADGRVALAIGAGCSLAAPWMSSPVASCDPEALAYVVYTSGSTGVPKGVEITRGNLDHLIDWHRTAFAVTAADRVGHVAGLGFDASFWEVWPALCAGASVVLADEDARTSPAALRHWLVEQGITIAFVPTVLAEILLGLNWPAETALRWMLTGGEALRVRPPRGLPFTLVNNYGPSECTVVATSGVIAPAADDGPPDIGRPVARTRIYLLDDRGGAVADGEIGEIVIGGAGVGRGYRNRPELTEERFLADRCHPEPGGLAYRTGDLGRRLPDGRIAFLGRRDEQEQIRGYRVEPGEVAAALMHHPSVSWCSVIADGSARDRRLIAYVLPAAGGRPSAEALRAFLATRLPPAMLPSAFVRIDAVPLSAAGKLDRDSLPAPGPANALPQAGFSAPTTPTQARLAAIISELLGRVPVGMDDNFFMLGGHSLLGTQVVMRARDAFGVTLSLRDLFEAPTVAELAERVAERLAEQLCQMTDDEVASWVAS
jgi:amino acid adenylation domain-containing protein